MDYNNILSDLEKIEPCLLSKLSIFYELRNQIVSEKFSKTETEEIVDRIYSIFIEYANDDNTPSKLAVDLIGKICGNLNLRDILCMDDIEFLEKFKDII